MNVGSGGGGGGGSQFLGGLDDTGSQPDPVTYICGGEFLWKRMKKNRGRDREEVKKKLRRESKDVSLFAVSCSAINLNGT